VKDEETSIIDHLLCRLRERLGTPRCGLSSMFEFAMLQELLEMSSEQQVDEFIDSLGGPA